MRDRYVTPSSRKRIRCTKVSSERRDGKSQSLKCTNPRGASQAWSKQTASGEINGNICPERKISIDCYNSYSPEWRRRPRRVFCYHRANIRRELSTSARSAKWKNHREGNPVCGRTNVLMVIIINKHARRATCLLARASSAESFGSSAFVNLSWLS